MRRWFANKANRILALIVVGSAIVLGIQAAGSHLNYIDSVEHETWGDVPVYVTGEGPTTIVLLHGYSGMPGDFELMASELTQRFSVRVAVPRAEHRARRRGFAWFRWPNEAGGRTAWLRSIRRGRARIESVIDHARATGARKIVLIGHSMGARMSMDVALSMEEAPAAVGFLAGAPLPTWRRDVERVSELRIFMAHSPDDFVLDFDTVVEIRDAMRADGAEVTWLEYEGGHGLTAEVQLRLFEFLGDVIDAPR